MHKLSAVLVLSLAAFGCGSSSTTPATHNSGTDSGVGSASDTGGTTTMTPADSGSTTTTPTTDSGTTTTAPGAETGSGGGCTAPSTVDDCTSCGTQMECGACVKMVQPTAFGEYQKLAQCVLATACYTSCMGSAAGAPAPSKMDACDTNMASDAGTACDTCQACAFMSTCMSQYTACSGDMNCVNLAQNLATICPQAM
jgi:hypothetical protein